MCLGVARASCSAGGPRRVSSQALARPVDRAPPSCSCHPRSPPPPAPALALLLLETQSQHGAVSLQVTRGPHTYSVGVCTAAAGLDEGGCKDGAVCLLSGSKGASFGRLASMKLDYRHQDEAVILSYANGDTCPPGKSLRAGGVSVPSRHGIRHGSRRELRNDAPDAVSPSTRNGPSYQP